MLFAHTILWIATLILPFFVAAHGENVTEVDLVGGTFQNSLKSHDGSDPFIVYTSGYYYLMTTTWKNVAITRSRTLGGLKRGETKVVFSSTNPEICCHYWAPELHNIGGGWYIYFTAGKQDLAFQRPLVLKATTGDIFGPYQYLGRLTNEWGIDGTVADINGKNYFVWSCIRGNLQSLCIAVMTAPDRIAEAHVISQPTNPWERAQGKLPVNEGPAVMRHNGRTFMTYSASYCWTADYSLGLLTLRGGDPLNAASWAKTGPVFRSANRNFGPGHNGFFYSPDGKEVWNVFHATANPGGNCEGNRYTMAQRVNWRPDGSPDFGMPLALTTPIPVPSGEMG